MYYPYKTYTEGEVMKKLVQARIDSELKSEAEEVLGRYGIDLPTLFRMTLHAVINAKGVPFPTSLTSELTAKEDYQDFIDADKAYKKFKVSGKETRSIHELKKELNKQ
jgi:addiction module RelB/DinJ family antitoxin